MCNGPSWAKDRRAGWVLEKTVKKPSPKFPPTPRTGPAVLGPCPVSTPVVANNHAPGSSPGGRKCVLTVPPHDARAFMSHFQQLCSASIPCVINSKGYTLRGPHGPCGVHHFSLFCVGHCCTGGREACTASPCPRPLEPQHTCTPAVIQPLRPAGRSLRIYPLGLRHADSVQAPTRESLRNARRGFGKVQNRQS